MSESILTVEFHWTLSNSWCSRKDEDCRKIEFSQIREFLTVYIIQNITNANLRVFDIYLYEAETQTKHEHFLVTCFQCIYAYDIDACVDEVVGIIAANRGYLWAAPKQQARQSRSRELAEVTAEGRPYLWRCRYYYVSRVWNQKNSLEAVE